VGVYNKGNNMALPFMAGGHAMRFLRTLYKGKKKLGSATKKAAEFAAKKDMPKTSQFITGASQKAHKGTMTAKKYAKKYPKTAAAISGAVAFDMFDDD
jgi:hypothetical protein|tara:strand:+ start:1005 stop:1298 length:294 start_codon:yes stop_codon:yes gene_type:complete